MQNRLLLTDEQLDYLRELMNIGAGHAARTLSIALRSPVNSGTPRVLTCSTREIAPQFGDQDKSAVGVRIDLSGQIAGFVYFIVPSFAAQQFVAMARPAPKRETALSDTMVMGMAAHIVVMSYLNAIRQFCGVDIRQSLPRTTIRMTQALVDEAVAAAGREIDVLIVKSNFTIGDERMAADRLSTYLLMFTEPGSIPILAGSFAEATRRMTGAVA